MHDQEQTDGVTAEADEPLEAGGYVGGVDNGNDRPSHKRYHGGEDAGPLDGDPARSHRAQEPDDDGSEQDESNDQNRQVRRPALDQRGKDRQATQGDERPIGSKGFLGWHGGLSRHPSALEIYTKRGRGVRNGPSPALLNQLGLLCDVVIGV